jgi:hypothetical protein
MADPLTDAQILAIRTRIGNDVPPSDDDLAVLFETLRSIDKVVLAVIEPRLEAMLTKPAKYTVDGDSSFDYTANLALMQKRVAEAQAQTGEQGLTVGRLKRKWRR